MIILKKKKNSYVGSVGNNVGHWTDVVGHAMPRDSVRSLL